MAAARPLPDMNAMDAPHFIHVSPTPDQWGPGTGYCSAPDCRAPIRSRVAGPRGSPVRGPFAESAMALLNAEMENMEVDNLPAAVMAYAPPLARRLTFDD